MKQEKIGVVAGSFDPFTRGHLFVTREGCALVDKLFVVIGVNRAKKAYFTPEERKHIIESVLKAKLSERDYAKIEIVFIEDELLINFASQIGAQYIFRGIRNADDLVKEYAMYVVNAKINPAIHTLYVPTPPNLVEVSSSTVKGLVGFKGWEAIVARYVHPEVVTMFKQKLAEREQAEKVGLITQP